MKTRYMELMAKANIIPNFFCSDEYFTLSALVEKIEDGHVYWFDPDTGWIVCPPLEEDTGKPITKFGPDWMQKVWADLTGWVMPGYSSSTFLDLEIIYNPAKFLKMEGGEWQTFRKNSRKYPNRFKHGKLEYERLENLQSKMNPIILKDRMMKLYSDWANHKEESIEDSTLIMRYIDRGENRKVLHNKGDIIGINIWDKNRKYVNFRFCICKNEDFLSEYMRLLFYTDNDILQTGLMVNDGGVLDNPRLEKFKMKMNPIGIRNVRSWVKSVELGQKLASTEYRGTNVHHD